MHLIEHNGEKYEITRHKGMIEVCRVGDETGSLYLYGTPMYNHWKNLSYKDSYKNEYIPSIVKKRR